MAFNLTRKISEGREEFLKFPSGLDAIKSIVVDAATVASGADGSRKLKAGTLMTRNPGNTAQYKAFASASGETIAGVLGNDIEVFDTSASSDKPADLYFHGCVFNSNKIVDFATYGALARTALPTCKFE